MKMINTINGYHIKVLFSFFFKAGVRAKRSKSFFLLSLIPTVLFIIIKVAYWNSGDNISMPNLFTQISGSFYFQLFIPLLCLFYGSSVMNDEVDDKTLIYLGTSPVSKASIILGKCLANFTVSIIIIISGLFLSYGVANVSHLVELTRVKELVIYTGVALLSIIAYSSLFTMLGTLMKKSILLGILFIGWEGIVQFIPGVTQKLTAIHYIKSLLPVPLSETNSFLTLLHQPSSVSESIITLLLLTVVFMAASIFIFYKKEYVLSDID